LQSFLHDMILNKKKKIRLTTVLLLLSLCVSIGVFWILRHPGIAMVGDADCGMTEHTHTEACVSCELQEHVHALECYSDEHADTETKADWELTLSGVPYSDSISSDLLAVAKTQLGYTESRANFLIDAGGNRRGYTRYGAWYGSPYSQWDAMFASFCLYYSGVPIGYIPMTLTAESMRTAWESIGQYRSAVGNTPEIGDLIFLDSSEDATADFVGIVSEVTDTGVKLILGDYRDTVSEITQTYESATILGYVDTDAIPDYLLLQGAARVERSVALDVMTIVSNKTSEEQIIQHGGANVASDGTKVSKTIAGTDIENIFDITLTVETQQKIEQVYKEPDMAVVIVMDISNTMNAVFGDTTRYKAAMAAAEDFIDHFSETAGNVSKIGYVAFNTSAHEIFSLQACHTPEQAAALKKKMRDETNKIISASGYAASRTRYTNIEGGLKRGWDMIKNAPQEHKYIIFLSDGFPTTYLKNHSGTDYVGYEPYSGSGTPGRDGVFYDAVRKLYLDAGASYSDKGAIYARTMATSIKKAGGTIFSIGIDIGGQTINGHLYTSTGANAYPVVDRTSTTYEIGSATSASSYKNWLKNSIGSGYYYDSTNTQGLKDAYEAIFNEIQHLREEESKAEWIACDPLPIMEDSTFKTVEFIGFYDKNKSFIPLSTSNTLTGTHTEGSENSATFIVSADQIDWDLKNSGFTSSTSGNLTTFTYELVYRVRLRNEDPAFLEHTEYHTNDVTTLSYRLIETVNGQTVISDNKSIQFPLPSVKGYLGELSFQKVDPIGGAVVGAEFTLSHDTEHCKICHGDGTSVTTVPDYVAVSNVAGKVVFENVPSGHRYQLVETGVPSGYLDTGRKYWAVVAYDLTTVNVATSTGAALVWNGKVLNYTPFDLPETGGPGTTIYTVVGFSILLIPLLYLALPRKPKRKDVPPAG